MRLKFTVVAMSIFLAFAAPPVTWAQGDDITALIAEANRHLNGDGVAQDYDAAIAGFGAALKKLDGLSEPRQGDQVVAHNQLGFAYHLTGRYAEIRRATVAGAWQARLHSHIQQA